MVITLVVTPEILALSNPSFRNIPDTTVEDTARRRRRVVRRRRPVRRRRRTIRRRRAPRRNPSRARALIRARAAAQARRAASRRRGINARARRRTRIIRAARARATRTRTITVGGVRRRVQVRRLGAGRRGAAVVSLGIKDGVLRQRFETVQEQRTREIKRRQLLRRQAFTAKIARGKQFAAVRRATAERRQALRFGGSTGSRAQRLARGRARLAAIRRGRGGRRGGRRRRR